MRHTCKRLLSMFLTLFLVFSVTNIFMLSTSAAEQTKLSQVLDGITTECSITVKLIEGNINLLNYNLHGTYNIYIKDNKIATVGTIMGFIKVKALLTADNVYAMIPLFRIFGTMSVTDFLKEYDISDDQLIDFDNDPNNGNGITIGAFRADPIAGIKKLYNEDLVRTDTEDGVSLNGETFSTETYSVNNLGVDLFTCYFSNDGSLKYIKVNPADTTMQNNYTLKVEIVPTVTNANAFNEPDFFYFNLTSFLFKILDALNA